jgi:hypothetical protein
MATWFSDDYKYQLFLLWYNNGRPSAKRLKLLIPVEWGEDAPTAQTLQGWIHGERFKDWASNIDNQVSNELEARLVKEKVEMLSRHAELGVRMQTMAMGFLDENESNLSANAAVRLLIEGIRVERESKGVPQAVEKMMNKSDDELVEDIHKLLKDSNIEILDG